jgi:hypothetical protein
MKAGILKCMACVAIGLGLSSTVQANWITGTIIFVGGLSVNTASVNNCTAITGFGPNEYVTASSGSYTPATYTEVTTTNTVFAFLPVLAPNPTINMWGFSVGGKMYSFDLTAVQSVSQNGGFLNISGRGMLHITGFTDTPGSVQISSQDPSAGVPSIEQTFPALAASLSANSLKEVHLPILVSRHLGLRPWNTSGSSTVIPGPERPPPPYLSPTCSL